MCFDFNDYKKVKITFRIREKRNFQSKITKESLDFIN